MTIVFVFVCVFLYFSELLKCLVPVLIIISEIGIISKLRRKCYFLITFFITFNSIHQVTWKWITLVHVSISVFNTKNNFLHSIRYSTVALLWLITCCFYAIYNRYILHNKL